MLQAVATSHEVRVRGLPGGGYCFLAHNPVHEQSPVLCEEHDFPCGNLLEAGEPDRNNIARKHRGNHACAEDAQPNLAKCADDFLGQSAPHFDGSVPLAIRSHYEGGALRKFWWRRCTGFACWTACRKTAPKPQIR